MPTFSRRTFIKALGLSVPAALTFSLRGLGFAQASGKNPLFELVPSAVSGIAWHHSNGRSPEYYLPETTGAGCAFLDYDNDGWLDLFIANGGVNIVEALRGQALPYRMTNQLFHNTGTGRFEETSAAGGPAFARAEIGRGAAFGDIDNDGDVDIVVTNNNGPVRLLLNQTRAPSPGSQAPSPGSQTPSHWLEVRVDQRPGNRFGFGVWIGLERTGRPTLWRRVRTDGSYLSASDVRVHFGLGSSPAVSAIVVQWPDGARERWTEIQSDRLLTLVRGSGTRE